MKKWTILVLLLVFLMTVGSILPVHGEAGLYDNVIRLHVLANSDAAGDQEDKLAMRDAVLAYTAPLLEGVQSRAEAERILSAEIPRIERIAEKTLEKRGTPAPVTVEFDEERYPRRTYESIALPAGEYLSLRVQIGEAAGQNWWCVLFPPLCLSAATADTKATCLSAGLTEEQYRVIADSGEGKYRLRFKILEVAEGLFH
jgi:stage II sporulation protein R